MQLFVLACNVHGQFRLQSFPVVGLGHSDEKPRLLLGKSDEMLILSLASHQNVSALKMGIKYISEGETGCILEYNGTPFTLDLHLTDKTELVFDLASGRLYTFEIHANRLLVQWVVPGTRQEGKSVVEHVEPFSDLVYLSGSNCLHLLTSSKQVYQYSLAALETKYLEPLKPLNWDNYFCKDGEKTIIPRSFCSSPNGIMTYFFAELSEIPTMLFCSKLVSYKELVSYALISKLNGISGNDVATLVDNLSPNERRSFEKEVHLNLVKHQLEVDHMVEAVARHQ